MNNHERDLFDTKNTMKFLFSIRCNRIKMVLLVFAVLVILSIFVCSAVQRQLRTTIAALQSVQNLTFSPGQEKRTGPTKGEHILFNGENLSEAYHDIDLMTQVSRVLFQIKSWHY